MKRMLPKPLRPYAPAVGIVLAGAVVTANYLHPTPMLVTGGILAALISITVLVEYLVLVPLRHNPGAKRLAGLLLALSAILTMTVTRYFFKDIPGTRELMGLLFWALFFALLYLGWHVWMDQLEGARAYRRKNQSEAERKQ